MDFRKIAETAVVATPLAVGNALAAVQGINWLGISAGITGIGTAIVAVFIKSSLDRAKLKRDIALLDIEVATKQFEFDEAKQKAVDSSIALKFAELEKEALVTRVLLESQKKVVETATKLADSLKRELDEVRKEQAVQIEKRHTLRSDVNATTSRIEATVAEQNMAKDAEIRKLKNRVEKVAIGVNANADAVHVVAEAAGLEPIEVGHIDDTSGDLPTLEGV